jgi:DNA repair protein RadA
MVLVDKAKDIIEKENIKLIIVDSLTSHFRAEFSGRGQLADRQQKFKQTHVYSYEISRNKKYCNTGN